jgi:WD40-like Beta Propeller Repeat
MSEWDELALPREPWDSTFLVIETHGARGAWLASYLTVARDVSATRIGLRGEFSWSPDGRRLAVGRGRDISVVRSDGQVSWRIRLRGPQEVRTLLWAPDGRNLLVELYPPNQIFIAGANGKGLRRVTHLGNSTLVGWTRVPPARPPLPALFPTERLAGPRTVSTRTPIATLSADGGRVAFAAMTTAADCGHVAVWTPTTRELARPARPAPCREWPPRSGIVDVELVGDRIAWVTERNCPNTCDTALDSRVLTARRFDRLAVNGSPTGIPSFAETGASSCSTTARGSSGSGWAASSVRTTEPGRRRSARRCAAGITPAPSTRLPEA